MIGCSKDSYGHARLIPGAEAFFVVEGEQCMDTPGEQTTIAAGGTYIVSRGPHVQAAHMDDATQRNAALVASL